LEGPNVKAGNLDSLDSPQNPVYGNFQPTGYEGISYMNASDGTAIKRYHVVIPIVYQRPVGVIELDLSLKRVIPDNVYPELLVDNRFNQIYRNKDFSYAVYNRSELVSSFGPFNYERDFRIDRLAGVDLFEAGIVDHNYFHIAIEDPDGPVAIVSAATYPSTSLVTNFSFWFVLGLAVLFLGQGIFGFYSYLKGQKINYTARIQVIIFLAFLLPVLAVSVTTLTLIGRSNEDTIRRDFLERSVTIGQRIASLIADDSTHVIDPARLETWIEENAATSKTDISVYAPGGRLIATSQPALFDDQLVSNLMDRRAWKRIALEKDERTVTEEQIGRLKYNCAYAAVLSPETGELLAIVALPFFESATFLQRSQGLILSNILIVFVVVFILFSLLSFWAASSLTFPIRFITRTLGQTTLTGVNKPLKWNSSDEIGTLVNEYNRMVQNLEESKSALAQSEKESAWREMARQVAHEIKNPLTPMKLTLQQMENALRAGNLSIEKSQKSVEVLLKQVDILNQIAASFSTFASMPAPSPQHVDINQLVRGTVELFEAATDGTIIFEPASGSHIVSVDPTSFSRAISNLVINALQARKDDQQKVEIRVRILREDGAILITIADNGRGMSPEVQEKVFQPQFTTKQSGSGLGLAMTRQIVRQAGGTIWFESSSGGTSFFIRLHVKS
jgi:signal transduction histidine kinase